MLDMEENVKPKNAILIIKFPDKELSYALKNISIDEYREVEKTYDDNGNLKDLILKEIKLKIEGALAEPSVENS